MNYFELFALEQNYTLDQKHLRKQYLALQEKYHPDKAKDELQRHKNAEHSMLINEAFKVLKDDYLRAEYILQLKGEALNDNTLKTVLSPIQLEEILEEYELIENIREDLSSLYSNNKKSWDEYFASKIEKFRTKSKYGIRYNVLINFAIKKYKKINV